jgi:phospholipase/carboxylesterase
MTARFSLTDGSRQPSPELSNAELPSLLTAARGTNSLPTLATPVDEPPQLSAGDVYIPEAYEPNYAYPLIVWLLDETDHAAELPRRMAQISTRNYFGAALRCTVPAADDLDAFAMLQQRLADLALQVRREFHIHSERIFVAGFDRHGTAALQLCLARPEWLAGAAVLGAPLPEMPRLLQRFRDLRGKRVFLATGEHDAVTSADDLRRTSRLLYTAGLRTCGRVFDAGHEITRSMLVEVDRWVMQEIHRPALAVS